MLIAVVGLYLWWMIDARRPQPSRLAVWGALVSPGLILAATVFGYLALDHVEQVFVASGPRSTDRAQHLLDGATALRAPRSSTS